MSATTATSSQTRQANPRRGRGRGGRNQGGQRRKNTNTPKEAAAADADAATEATGETTMDAQNAEDVDTCWICAEPVKYYSVSECNHRTCHVCALRLRALYKRMDCTFCKHSQATLIFTSSPDKEYESFAPESIPFKDSKLSIYFETQEMMEDSLILLRFNCPDSVCDFIAHGWGDLKMHVRAIHGKSMCDMCIRHKKVFSHEHILYQPSQLPLHLPSISHRPPGKNQTHNKVEGGVHPMCEFCRECYFGDDELFAHMRERHEECFLCKRSGIRDQYFKDYNSLEQHFNTSHFPCKDAQCQAQKFVVFGSVLDLKAHLVEQHGKDMSAKDLKDMRRLEASFEYDDGAAARQGRGRGRGRDREPPEDGPSRNSRREGFGSTLTDSTAGTPPQPPQPQPVRERTEPDTPIDPAVAARHAAFISRLNVLTGNSPNAVPAVRAAIRSYRASESGPRDLISTIFNVVDRDLDNTASLISAFVDLLDNEEKRRDLLASWNGFKIEQHRQFPELQPTPSGSEYAGVAGGRILNAKHSAAVRSASGQSQRQVWDRVAQAAASSSTAAPAAVRPQERFPSLAASRNAPAFRQPQHTTAWSSAAASSSSSSLPAIRSVPAPSRASPRPAAPTISASHFPSLPSSASNRSRPQISGNQSLKNILGDTGPKPVNAWGQKSGEGSQMMQESTDSQPEETAGKGRKKKGKEKQTLFTFGTFPS